MLGISQLNCVFAQKYITLILKMPKFVCDFAQHSWSVKADGMAGQNNLQQREKPSQEVPVLHTSTTATAPGAATSTTVKAPGAATSTTATAPDVP